MTSLILFSVKGFQKNPKESTYSNEPSNQTQRSLSKELDEFHSHVVKHFKNCQKVQILNETVYLNCSIPTKDYANFLYDAYKKEYTQNIKDLYRQQNRMDEITSNFQNKIKDLVMSVFNEWIQIFKPNTEIPVEQMYKDSFSLVTNVLDVIEHEPEKYKDMINMYKTFYSHTFRPIQYLTRGGRSSVKEDMTHLWNKYVGSNYDQIQNTKMPFKKYIFYLRDLSFYVVFSDLPTLKHSRKAQLDQQQNFEATSFVLQEALKIRHLIGDQIGFGQTSESRQIIIKKFVEYVYAKIEALEDESNSQQKTKEARIKGENRNQEQF